MDRGALTVNELPAMADAKRLLLIGPRGFCAGVVRAVDAVWIALDRFGPPIYVRHEIVHNEHVLRDLREAGAVFVAELDDVPDGARVFFSAHGVSPEVRLEAERRGLAVIDATCPLVTKVHRQVVRLDQARHTIILIGHRGHVEVAGTRGEAPESTIVVSNVEEAETVVVADPDSVGYVTQTTLALAEVADITATLERRFPKIKAPASQDVCYATENRQAAVRAAAAECDLILVVGSKASSNSESLVRTALQAGVRACRVDGAENLPLGLIKVANSIGLTGGASTPEPVIQEVKDALVGSGFSVVEELESSKEHVVFAPPQGLEPGKLTFDQGGPRR